MKDKKMCVLHPEKNDQHMQVIGLHQNRPAQASKLTMFRVSNQHMQVSAPACSGKLTQKLVNFLASAVGFDASDQLFF